MLVLGPEKTVLGTRATLYVPRTVFQVLGLHLSQDPSEKGGVLAQENKEYHVIVSRDSHPHNVPHLLSGLDDKLQMQAVPLTVLKTE